MTTGTTVRRAALLRLDIEILQQLLVLPDGWHVESVRDDWARDCVLVRVTGPNVPTCAPNAYPYELQVTTTVNTPPEGSPPGTMPTLSFHIDWEDVPR